MSPSDNYKRGTHSPRYCDEGCRGLIARNSSNREELGRIYDAGRTCSAFYRKEESASPEVCEVLQRNGGERIRTRATTKADKGEDAFVEATHGQARLLLSSERTNYAEGDCA